MSIQNILLLVTGLINLVMSVVVFSRGIKNKINLYFGLLTFFNFLWAGGLIVVNLGISYELTRFFASFIYPVALMVVTTLLYFVVYFPYKIFDVPKFYKNLILFFIAIFTIFCIIGYKIFVWEVVLYPKVVVYYEFWSYSFYALVLLIFMVASIAILFLKFKKVEGVLKRQLLLILLAVILGTAVGAYSNLFLMYFYVLDYNHLGPLFTLAINFVVFYFIFFANKYKKLL